MSEHQRGWKYDKKGLHSFSRQEERLLFLRAIPSLRFNAVSSLYQLAFLSYVNFVIHRFRKFLPDPSFSSNPTRSEIFRHIWNIPKFEVEIDAIGGWNALRRKKKTKELVGLIEKWAQEYNLKVDWCLDHAVHALRGWLYEENMRWVDEYPSFLDRTLVSGWLDDLTRVEMDVVYSRYELQMTTLSGSSGDPPQFVFEWKGLRFELPGWNYLREGKDDWRQKVEQEFDIFKSQRKAARQPVPVGYLTRLRKAAAEHVKEQDAARRAAVKEHGLVKRPRNYAGHSREDHVRWLIMYQVPPCQKYNDIAAQAGKSVETVRKHIVPLATRIDLPLRDKSLHAGSPSGKARRRPHRAVR